MWFLLHAKCILGTTDDIMINTIYFRKRNNISISINLLLLWHFACIRAHQASCARNPNFILHSLLCLPFYIHQVRKSSNAFPHSSFPLISHVSYWLSILQSHLYPPQTIHTTNPAMLTLHSSFRLCPSLLKTHQRLPVAFRIDLPVNRVLPKSLLIGQIHQRLGLNLLSPSCIATAKG